MCKASIEYKETCKTMQKEALFEIRQFNNAKIKKKNKLINNNK